MCSNCLFLRDSARMCENRHARVRQVSRVAHDTQLFPFWRFIRDSIINLAHTRDQITSRKLSVSLSEMLNVDVHMMWCFFFHFLTFLAFVLRSLQCFLFYFLNERVYKYCKKLSKGVKNFECDKRKWARVKEWPRKEKCVFAEYDNSSIDAIQWQLYTVAETGSAINLFVSCAWAACICSR